MQEGNYKALVSEALDFFLEGISKEGVHFFGWSDVSMCKKFRVYCYNRGVRENGPDYYYCQECLDKIYARGISGGITKVISKLRASFLREAKVNQDLILGYGLDGRREGFLEGCLNDLKD